MVESMRQQRRLPTGPWPACASGPPWPSRRWPARPRAGWRAAPTRPGPPMTSPRPQPRSARRQKETPTA